MTYGTHDKPKGGFTRKEHYVQPIHHLYLYSVITEDLCVWPRRLVCSVYLLLKNTSLSELKYPVLYYTCTCIHRHFMHV